MNYHNLTYPDMNNGEGLRVVLWLSGCSHHCKGCQNPQTWDENSGVKFDKQAEEELFRELEKDYVSGITFSGGDPLHTSSIIELLNLIKTIKFKFPKKTIWLYTGYCWEDIFTTFSLGRDHKLRQTIIKLCDVLIDGKYVEELRDITLKWRGSSNQRVIDVQKSMKENKIVLLEEV